MTAVRPAVGLVWGLSVAMVAAATVFLVLGPGRPLPSNLFGGVSGAAFLLLSLAYATVGAIIVARLPGHRIGWLFSVIGLLVALNGLAYGAAAYFLYATSWPVPAMAGSVQGWGQVTAPLLGLSLLLFPDGRLPSRRWWPVAAMTLVAILGFLLAAVLRPGPFDDPFTILSNPVGVPGLRDAMIAVNQVAWAFTCAVMALGVLAVFVRLRRSRGLERQQLKLVLAVAAAVGAITLGVMVTWFIWPAGGLPERIAVMGLAFTAFPVAAGIAILRSRLYDIDVVINRALVYGALTVLLGATYAAIALLLGTALGSGSAPATAAATLAVAMAFGPLRARVQDAVDCRFSSAQYDASVVWRRSSTTSAPAARPRRTCSGSCARSSATRGSSCASCCRMAGATSTCAGRRPSTRRATSASARRSSVPARRSGWCSTRRRPRIAPICCRAWSRRRCSRSRSSACGSNCAISSTRSPRRGRASSPPATPSAGGSSATSTTAPSSGSSRSGSRCGTRSTSWARTAAPRETLDGALAEIAIAIRELRELARGLRPAQLDAGLGPPCRSSPAVSRCPWRSAPRPSASPRSSRRPRTSSPARD